MPFGELGDIVVDPVAGDVTHLVIQPHNDHFQARLVPIGLVSEDPAGLTVQLDTVAFTPSRASGRLGLRAARRIHQVKLTGLTGHVNDFKNGLGAVTATLANEGRNLVAAAKTRLHRHD